jgi:hypothetical protein
MAALEPDDSNFGDTRLVLLAGAHERRRNASDAATTSSDPAGPVVAIAGEKPEQMQAAGR